jgi:serine-type D-Ala-D-Ala carboxypeptidase/endopeptidase
VWHNGRTAGFASMVVADPARGIGVAVLGNAYVGVDDLALHLMDASRPLLALPVQWVAVQLEPTVIDRVVGRYELAPNVVLAVTRDGERTYAQLSGQGRNEIFAASEFEYFLRAVDAQLSFQRGVDGRVASLVLKQNGRAIPGKRID